MLNDTSLIRMVVESLVERYNWSYDDALDKFYNSKVCEGISDKSTGMFTFALKEIVELFAKELGL